MAENYPITIEQGADFWLGVQWEPEGIPADLDGATGRAQVRAGYDAADALLSFDVDLAATAQVSDGNGGFTDVDCIAVSASSEDTTDLTFGRGVWDLEIESSGGEVTRVLQGTALLSREVTR